MFKKLILLFLLILTAQTAHASYPKSFFGEYEPLKLRGNFLPRSSATVRIHFIPTDPFYGSKGNVWSSYTQLDDLWGLKLMHMSEAWDFTKGDGIIVAVLDTGTSAHADLVTNMIDGWDYVDNDSNPTDLNGHGTHVSGTIAAASNNIGIVGVAPEAKIMPVRVLDASGTGSIINIGKGIHYATDHGADVINMSLGAYNLDAISAAYFYNEISYATSRGVIVVVSAGNDNNDIAKSFPAMFDNVISVGALRHQYDIYSGSGPLSRASFSDYGEELDFSAPGVDILSLAASPTIHIGYGIQNGGLYYAGADGTSMAAPHVTGLVALLLAQDPMQSFDDIYRRLRYSSTDLGTPGFDNYYGYGLVNAFAALSNDYYSDGLLKTHRTPDGAHTEYTYWNGTSILKLATNFYSNTETGRTQYRQDGSIFYVTVNYFNENGQTTNRLTVLNLNMESNFNIEYLYADGLLMQTNVYVRLADGSNGDTVDYLSGAGEIDPEAIFQNYADIYLGADGDSDFDVDQDDYSYWRSHMGETGESSNADYNSDGSVDSADYVTWRKAQGRYLTLPPPMLGTGSTSTTESDVFGGEGYFEMQQELSSQNTDIFSKITPKLIAADPTHD